MNTTFYIPEHHLPDKERRDAWEAGNIPSLLGGGKAASAQAWLFQTWIEVREKTKALLSTTLPGEGVVITLSNFLPSRFRASKKQFVAAVVADFLPHPGAQLQILQNAAHAQRLPGSIFMPHWPQPNLIPRDPNRADRFETLAYFGDSQNLAPELRDAGFQKELQTRCGLKFEIRNPETWHDYSNVDAILAIRDFSRARHLHKPATKLYNAWSAGVPLVAGRESALEAEGRNGVDYLCARSPEHLLDCLVTLKNDIALRRCIVAEGQKKSASRNRDAVRGLWLTVLEQLLPAEFEKWISQGDWMRQLGGIQRQAVCLWDKKFRS